MLLTGLLPVLLTIQVANGPVQTLPRATHAEVSGQTRSTRSQAKGARGYEVGHLRHLHWLPPKDGIQRFATVAHVVTATDPRSAGYAAPLATLVQVRDAAGELEAQLSVPFDLLPKNSWTHNLTWRVLPFKSGLALAFVDRKGRRFHLVRFSSGEDLVASRPATRLLDVRQRESGAECLVESDGRLEHLIIGDEGDALTVTTLGKGTGSAGSRCSKSWRTRSRFSGMGAPTQRIPAT